MPCQRTIRTLIPLLCIPLFESGSLAQPIPNHGDLLVSAIDNQTNLPDIFTITPDGLVGETGLLPNELSTTVELSPGTSITESGLVLVVVDNGSGMLRFTYLGNGSNEGGPVYTSLINTDLGFDSFDSPIVAFDNPIVAFDNPIVAFTPGMMGLEHPMRANMPDFFEDPLLGFEDPLLGFEDALFGFEDPLLGFTADSAVVSYPNLNQEYELTIIGGTVAAGLAYPRAWFIDPNELDAFDGVDGAAHTNYAGFAVFSYDAPSGPGMYLAPLDRASIESQTLDLQPFATGEVFGGPFAIDGMHVDPVIPGRTYVWGTEGVTRGTSAPEPVIYRVNADASVTELTRGGNMQSIDDLVVALDGTMYVLDATSHQGSIVAIDTQTGTQSVLASGGATFKNPSSLSVVQQRSKTIEVNTTIDLPDPTPGDGDYFNPGFLLTLRAIIEEANAQDIPHTIVLPAGTYNISSLGEISIETSITIVGDGSSTTTITGDNTSRVLNVASTGMLKLLDIAIEDGQASSGGGNILSAGPVALESVVISGGAAPNDGGGISTTASLYAYKSHFTGNQANGDGGAIYISAGKAIINRCSIFQNEALNGGGVYAGNAAVDMLNTTFYLNLSFWEGGAVRAVSNQPVRMLHCTLLENEAGIFADNDSAGGFDSTGASVQAIIKSSVLANNTFDGKTIDIAGGFALADHSLMTNLGNATFETLTSVMAGDNPEFLGTPVQLGTTFAFSMMPTSPIIDAGATGEIPAFDQLGYYRLIDGDGDTVLAPDMGAYELGSPCQADMNNDGSLDFFDISAFLLAFSSQDPSADFQTDGMFDFFDISHFLSLFSAGCP